MGSQRMCVLFEIAKILKIWFGGYVAIAAHTPTPASAFDGAPVVTAVAPQCSKDLLPSFVGAALLKELNAEDQRSR
jgi:hypothetical protein